jgi:hypothetical protein
MEMREGEADVTVSDEWSTLPMRLQWAIDRQPWQGRRRGLRLFQSRIEERARELEKAGGKLEGVHLSSIQGYVSGDVEPSLTFLREAADLLAVRRAWLIEGDGVPSALEESARRRAIATADPGGQRLRDAITTALPWADQGSRSESALWSTMWILNGRLLDMPPIGTPYTEVSAFEVALAGRLAESIRAPLDALGLKGRPFDQARLDRYTVLVAHAIEQLLYEIAPPYVADSVSQWRFQRDHFLAREDNGTEEPHQEG